MSTARGCLLVVLVALAFRLPCMTWGLPSQTGTLSSHHPDETFAFLSLEHMRATRSPHPGRGLWYGSLFPYLSAAVVGGAYLLRIVPVGSREFLLAHPAVLDRTWLLIRGVSLFGGLGAIALVFLLAARWRGKKAALSAAFFLVLAPVVIIYSTYLKVESLMMFWDAAVLFSIFIFFRSGEKVGLLWAGAFIGFAASTKYPGGFYIMALPLAVLLARRPIHWILQAAIVSGLVFLAVNPYVWLDFPTFWKAFREQSGCLTGTPVWEIGQNGPWRIASYYLPFSVGWLPWLLSLCGFARLLKKREPFSLFLLIFGAYVFLTVALPKLRYAGYTIPFLPIAALAAGYGAEWLFEKDTVGLLVAAVIFLSQTAYALGLVAWMRPPDPRNEASAWITAHIPAGSSIGIFKSYYWTPAAIRQTPSAYHVLASADIPDATETGLMRFPQGPRPEWWVASDLEADDFVRHRDVFPQIGTAMDVFHREYHSVVAFSKPASFFGIPLWWRQPPWDFRYIAPRIDIFERTPHADRPH